ncbi:MAG: beta-galactosidase [Anaerolineae bacterium]|nr:beta-galactosidase [Anaerolineae bacterium]
MMSEQTPDPRLTRRRQIRSFAMLWSVLTVIIGVITFIAIFVASGFILSPATGSNAVSAAEITSPPPLPATSIPATPIPMVVPQVAQQNPPTDAPAEADSGGEAPAAVAQAVTDTPEPTPEPTLSAIERTDFDFGIQVQESFDIYDYWMIVVSDQLHLDWVKHQVRWEDMQPTQGEIDWTILDIVIPTAHAHGLNVMLSIVTTPEWAREPGADLTKHGPPADPQNYVNFVTAILNRYQDEYPGTIGAIEVWNEMNIDREWASVNGLDSGEYIELLAATYNAVKAIDPGIIVISGALSPTGGWVEPDGRVSAVDDFDYLDALIRDGLLSYTDCVGAHHNGYNIGPLVPWDEAPNDPEAATAIFRGPFDNPHHSWSLYSTLTTYRSKIQLAGGDQRLCVTEFGWAVTEDMGGFPAGFEFAQDNTLVEQGEYIMEAVQWMAESDVVWLAWLWNLNYGIQSGFDPNNDNGPYSILRPNSVPAPAWDAIAQYRMEQIAEQ